MTVLGVILGVLIMALGIVCIVFNSYVAGTVFFFTFGALLAFGLASIINCVVRKNFGVVFIVSIVACVAAIIIMAVPPIRVLLIGLLIYLISGWMVAHGIISVWVAIRGRNSVPTAFWIIMLVLGVLTAAFGIFCIIQPQIMNAVIGVVIGISFIETGIQTVLSTFMNRDKLKRAKA